MKKYLTGEVYELGSGHKIIVISSNDKLVNWISFEATNASGNTPIETEIKESDCPECVNVYGEIFDWCETCHGAGVVLHERHGMDRATKLAGNAKEYIMKKFKMMMGI